MHTLYKNSEYRFVVHRLFDGFKLKVVGIMFQDTVLHPYIFARQLMIHESKCKWVGKYEMVDNYTKKSITMFYVVHIEP